MSGGFEALDASGNTINLQDTEDDFRPRETPRLSTGLEDFGAMEF